MNKSLLNRAAVALLPAALVILASCESDKPTVEKTTTTSVQQGVPGGIVVDTYKMSATVTGIDSTKREVTLVTPEGKKSTVKCGPEVINFDQIRIGDQLTVTLIEEVAVYMATSAPTPDNAAVAVALAPKGVKPGGIIAGTVQITATVTEIDLKRHKATLKFADGSTRTIAVRQDVDLTQRKVGEQVVIRTTGAIAILVNKP